MKILTSILSIIILFCSHSYAEQKNTDIQLAGLKNFQTNTSTMISSGLPSRKHFQVLKNRGLTKVIDLIPGDRTEESNLMKNMNLAYHNIPVEWENPTLNNFKEYIAFMKQESTDEGITLTHCKLNWRGATFTYLYRVTQLKEPEEIARVDMLAIWQPNETWKAFIDKVKSEYN